MLRRRRLLTDRRRQRTRLIPLRAAESDRSCHDPAQHQSRPVPGMSAPSGPRHVRALPALRSPHLPSMPGAQRRRCALRGLRPQKCLVPSRSELATRRTGDHRCPGDQRADHRLRDDLLGADGASLTGSPVRLRARGGEQPAVALHDDRLPPCVADTPGFQHVGTVDSGQRS